MHGGLRLSPTAGTYHRSPNGRLPRFTVTLIEFLSGSMVLASDVRLFILIGMVLLLFRPFAYSLFRPERTSTSAAARRPPPRPPPARSPQATPTRPGAGLRRIPLPGRPLTRMCSGRRGDTRALTDSATDCRSSQLSDRPLVARCWCVCGDEDHRAAAVVDQVRGRSPTRIPVAMRGCANVRWTIERDDSTPRRVPGRWWYGGRVIWSRGWRDGGRAMSFSGVDVPARIG